MLLGVWVGDKSFGDYDASDFSIKVLKSYENDVEIHFTYFDSYQRGGRLTLSSEVARWLGLSLIASTESYLNKNVFSAEVYQDKKLVKQKAEKE